MVRKKCQLEKVIGEFACLGCPLPECIKDMPGTISQEDEEILRLTAEKYKDYRWTGTHWVRKI